MLISFPILQFKLYLKEIKVKTDKIPKALDWFYEDVDVDRILLLQTKPGQIDLFQWIVYVNVFHYRN